MLRIAVAMFTTRTVLPTVTNGLLLSVGLLTLATIFGVVCLVGEYVLRTLRQVTETESYHVLEEIGGNA